MRLRALFWVSLFLGGAILGSSAVVVVLHSHMTNATYSFLGTLLGGALSGLFTVIGVVVTVIWSDSQFREDRLLAQESQFSERKIHCALVLGEIEINKAFLETAIENKSRNPLAQIQFDTWNELRAKFTWMETVEISSVIRLCSSIVSGTQILSQLDKSMSHEELYHLKECVGYLEAMKDIIESALVREENRRSNVN